ncbi:MAG: HD domain-containing protein, partial [Planctomycetes bacterium]|nr:HD domain-containing protein [Planctomycetota bacterium]
MEQTGNEEKPYETVLRENQVLRRRLRELEDAPRKGRDAEQRENLVKLLEIKNRQLEQSFAELERGNRQLADAHKRTERYYVSTILSLVQVSEARDPFFAQHSRSVASCARGIGRTLGWDTERLGLLETAGHLHDFGNLGVPPELLHKSGPLEPSERALVRTHPTIARQILEPIGPLALILDWIAQHHERPDGKGYPKGIQG